MNGEMYQICRITAAAKNALKTGASIQYEPLLYEKCIGFQFLPEKKLFGTKQVKAKGVEEWYVHCCKKGMRESFSPQLSPGNFTISLRNFVISAS